MEDSRPPVNEDEARLSSNSNKRSKRLLAPWQNRLHELFADKPGVSKEEKDTDNEKTTKSRFSRIWEKFFGSSIASIEPLPLFESSQSQADSKTEQQDAWYALGGANIEKADATLPNIEPTPPGQEKVPEIGDWSSSLIVEGETKINHDQEYHSPKFTPEMPQTVEVSIVEISVEPTISKQAKQPEVEPESSISVPVEPKSSEIINQDLNYYEDLVQRQETGRSLRPDSGPEHIQSDHQKIERKLDYQTYKLKRELKKREEKLEQIVKKNKQTPEKLFIQPEISAPSPQRIKKEHFEYQPQRFERLIERRETTERLPTITQQNQATPEFRPVPTISPELTPEASLEVPKAEIVLEKVLEAAEHNEPIEKRYEQRHEIKDTDSVIKPLSIGKVITDALEKHNQQVVHAPLTSAESLRQVLARQQRPAKQDVSYASAIRWGFWSAVTIIVFGVITYLLRG